MYTSHVWERKLFFSQNEVWNHKSRNDMLVFGTHGKVITSQMSQANVVFSQPIQIEIMTKNVKCMTFQSLWQPSFFANMETFTWVNLHTPTWFTISIDIYIKNTQETKGSRWSRVNWNFGTWSSGLSKLLSLVQIFQKLIFICPTVLSCCFFILMHYNTN